MNQSMEKIQRLFNTMQEKIDEKWEKNYVEFDCKMQLEEELLNKVRITEVKKFDKVVRILEIHYQCGKNGVRNDGNECYNHYNNYEQRKYNYSGQGRNNHNYSQGPYQGNQFYHYHKNRNSRSCGRNLNRKKIIQQPRKNVDTIEGSDDHQDSDDHKEKEKSLYKINRFYQ
ncbi:hypothetical protein FQA39_LY16616 [Lamprigera yunnana]|nr:hypothetical protein FQA39_LY16616 [Lamprigera yunnana]